MLSDCFYDSIILYVLLHCSITWDLLWWYLHHFCCWFWWCLIFGFVLDIFSHLYSIWNSRKIFNFCEWFSWNFESKWIENMMYSHFHIYPANQLAWEAFSYAAIFNYFFQCLTFYCTNLSFLWLDLFKVLFSFMWLLKIELSSWFLSLCLSFI